VNELELTILVPSLSSAFLKPTFRGKQKEIVEAAVRGCDVLVVAPTGMGKVRPRWSSEGREGGREGRELEWRREREREKLGDGTDRDFRFRSVLGLVGNQTEYMLSSSSMCGGAWSDDRGFAFVG